MPILHALLLTDVVDSTRLTEKLGDAAMAGLWAAHDRIARDLLPLWRGREIDKTDGMLLLFDDVRDAVGYALAYHRALAARELPFKARAGIHVGPVSLRPNPPEDVARGAKPVEVDGLALPIAARVMSVALGAQTLLSADARLALGVVSQRVVSHGHWRMHGVVDPVELFEVGEAGETGKPGASGEHSGAPFHAPPDSAKVYRVMRQGDLWQPMREVRHSVPAERDSFVGRQEPLQLLAAKFADGVRLVSVLGIGGTGKTRLVTRFAWTVLGDYPGGVWFCDLAQARTVDGIHFAVSQGLDVPLGKTDPVVQLAHAIAGRGKCLVILDNFEQVARHAEETLGHWLDRAPLAHFLVTTREVLSIVGESTLALDPLGMTDAAALFLRRAESAKYGYAASAADLLAIEQLVKVLDGLPLAIELAAARVRVMTPRALVGRMHERFNVLLSRAGRRDRQATLRAAFDWSWELLSEIEKAALAQLSVFRGGCTPESVSAVLELPSAGGESPSPVDVVHWLVDKSFVRQIGDERFDLLESVREYAAEHLRTEGRFEGSGPDTRAAAEARHSCFFARLDPKVATSGAGAELDNLVAACRRATAWNDAAIAVAALRRAWGVLRLRGPFRVGIELAEAVNRIAPLDGRDRVEADLILGSALQLSGLAMQAQARLLAAQAGARALGDSDLEGRALHPLATLQAQSGEIDMAAQSYERAMACACDGTDRSQECAVLNGLGAFSESLGRIDEARLLYARALALARAIGDRRWEGGTAGNLAGWFASQGNPAEARTLYAQSIAIATELGDRQWEANALCNLGLLHHAEGRFDDAQRALEASLATARDLGHARLLCIVQCNLGLVAEARGDPAAALGHHEAALTLARDLADRRSEGQFFGHVGLLHARQGRVEAARECLAAGEALLLGMSDRVSLGILLCASAQAHHLAGNLGAAGAALHQASELAAAVGDTSAKSEFGLALQQARAIAFMPA